MVDVGCMCFPYPSCSTRCVVCPVAAAVECLNRLRGWSPWSDVESAIGNLAKRFG